MLEDVSQIKFNRIKWYEIASNPAKRQDCEAANQPTNQPSSQPDKRVDRHDETQKHYNCNRFYFSRPMYKQR